ncbi:hypothetical protein [Xanthomonas rydalmerensis]|uniref:Uncharacterized protein n=1 Tax=Xanthomonas rydalmerensis TaxID=3046274 RepID=A0ABZ0JMB1_9XANT|nr:hypothetical protein [Xanthomonas sp. DM-2023]WOS40956.1 hypothetical protein QN243_00215 [Xanthomonas sp. DM-2023]WOS45141.1 hypothetical protein QN242_00215 [Xanthomonas sp. DM-2023]WOS49320.1 hypothetical protein QN240_00215 [Xanthomonas sp. DM-2023]WOS53500.1 hypothetical protein QN244_00215 [Xanthomonas sp. DM-2023]WOS57683.1 hypothetical protein QN245_00215 [Xanthomonas sp. DM-2023]
MDITVKQKALRDAVDHLREKACGMSRAERQDGLIDVGCAASVVDVASLDDPDADRIKEETNKLVDEAELIVKAHDQNGVLTEALSTRVRAISNRRRI